MPSAKLTSQWQHLMTMCAKERELRASNKHPKLLKLVTVELNRLAAEMGFTAKQIRTREFRAERDGNRIVRVLTTD